MNEVSTCTVEVVEQIVNVLGPVSFVIAGLSVLGLYVLVVDCFIYGQRFLERRRGRTE